MAENTPKHETEFLVMRITQLPSHVIGGQAHQQNVQINCNVLTDETPAQTLAKIKRMEDLIRKIQALHEVRFIEEHLRLLRTRAQSEMDVYESLQKAAKQEGSKMKDNAKAALANLPKQIEKTKLELGMAEEDLEERRTLARELL